MHSVRNQWCAFLVILCATSETITIKDEREKKRNNFHIRHYNAIIDEWKCNNGREREKNIFFSIISQNCEHVQGKHIMDCTGWLDGVCGKGKIERPCYDVFIKALCFDNGSICLFVFNEFSSRSARTAQLIFDLYSLQIWSAVSKRIKVI